jgi:hypothetical protein
MGWPYTWTRTHGHMDTDTWTHGPVEQIRRSHTATAIWFLTNAPKMYVGEKMGSSTNGVEKTG